jgi:hypothetical protein
MKMLLIGGLVFNVAGTIALAKGLILSDEQIRRQSGTYYDNNKYMSEGLLNNREWAYVGFALIGIGFIFQLVVAIL